MDKYRAYWSCEPDHAPQTSGAADVMECPDLFNAMLGVGLDPWGMDVVDIGCGTGRFAKFCKTYTGYDVSPGMVEYARRNGLDAHVITSLDDIDVTFLPDCVVCFSVFTHIDTADRHALLRKLREFDCQVVCDIIEGGSDGGSISFWSVPFDVFMRDVRDAGFVVKSVYARVAPDETTHTYFRLFPTFTT